MSFPAVDDRLSPSRNLTEATGRRKECSPPFSASKTHASPDLRSPAEKRILSRKIVEQGRECALCHEEFTDSSDKPADHRPKKSKKPLRISSR